jgi:WhiB family transcriptional regulator, redox-sensing transcriptional regulator
MITGDFVHQGACTASDIDPETFFPLSDVDTARIAEAKRICGQCQVKAECLEFALQAGVQGIWGETTDTERAALRLSRVTKGDGAEEVAA